ncbi:hypothetical protein [Pseudomonas cannabina]|uniref:hypothetical protein n=1 Tax=Pseudomonas cannabina TaxID=86840 RepID=UPI000EFEDD53|nr:hypothetical protein [Pseudomonas cannabina]
MKYVSIVIVLIGVLLMAVPELAPMWLQASLLILGIFCAGFSWGAAWEVRRSAKRFEVHCDPVRDVSE